MRKILFLTGLVIVGVCLSCTEKKLQREIAKSVDSVSSISSSKTNDSNDNNVSYKEVDKSLSKRYYDYEINEAKQRERYTSKLPKINSASSFGKKKAEVVWRAFVRDENKSFMEDGTVTVTHYENGLKISRNSKSWYYGNIKYDGIISFFHTTATESILHPGIWEPAYLELEIMAQEPDLYFNLMYKGNCPDNHSITMHSYECKKLKINSNNDMQISVEEY